VVSEKDLKSPLAWWKTHESQFPNFGSLTRQILGIPGCELKLNSFKTFLVF
jgi:hypothetical protein